MHLFPAINDNCQQENWISWYLNSFTEFIITSNLLRKGDVRLVYTPPAADEISTASALSAQPAGTLGARWAAAGRDGSGEPWAPSPAQRNPRPTLQRSSRDPTGRCCILGWFLEYLVRKKGCL